MPRDKRLHFKDIAALKALVFIPIYLYCILFLISISNQGTIDDITGLMEELVVGSIDFFFFLSAFLLISHGLREYKYTDKFSLRNFYIRRFLRIAPVLFMGLIFAFLIHPWLNVKLDLQPIVLPSVKYYLLGIPNYMTNIADEQLIYLQVICSIYLFIQAYFFLGIILRYFVNHLMIIGCITIIIGLVARGYHFWDSSEFIMDTLSYGAPIGVGIITAISVRGENKLFQWVKDFSKRTNSIIYIVGFFVLLGGYIITSKSIVSIFIPFLISLFYSYIVIEQTFGKHSFIQLKTNKILSYIGKLNYGMVIYQAIISVLIMIAFQSLDININSIYMSIIIIIGGYVTTIVVADLSFKLIEKPILRIRREFKKI